MNELVLSHRIITSGITNHGSVTVAVSVGVAELGGVAIVVSPQKHRAKFRN